MRRRWAKSGAWPCRCGSFNSASSCTSDSTLDTILPTRSRSFSSGRTQRENAARKARPARTARTRTTNMHNMTQVRRARLAAFAAAQATTAGGMSSQLQISALRDYRLREPVSGRAYTIIKLQTRGGLEGYGECGSATSTELAQAMKVVLGKEATQFETVRFQLKSAPPGLTAALNM